MIIQYKVYEDKYFNDLKHITLNSFKLTSFHVDNHLKAKKIEQVPWKQWCEPVLRSDKKKYCLVAVLDDHAVGFLIYGAHAEYSKVTGKKIGSIILLAVDKKYQGRYNIADTLLKYLFKLYKKYNFDVITVGTDLNNIPATVLYQKNAFRPVLYWSTFRYYYSDRTKKKENFNYTINERKTLLKKYHGLFKRPVSLLFDNRIEASIRKRLVQYNRDVIQKEIKERKILLFEVIKNKKKQAFFTIVREKVSDIIGMDFYRLNDLVFCIKDKSKYHGIISDICCFIKKKFKTVECLEIFLKADDWTLIEALNKSGFILVHHAVTLHKFMGTGH